MSKVCSVEYCPSSQNKGNYQDGKCDEDLKNFFLICCEHEGTSKDQGEPIDGNAQGQQSVAQVEKEHQEDMKQTESNIIRRQTDKDNEDMEVSQTEEAVKDNQPIKKGFGSLIYGENDHWYIRPQYKSTCKYLSQP